MQHGDVFFYITMGDVTYRRAASGLFFFYLSHGLIRVCEIELLLQKIELSHMVKQKTERYSQSGMQENNYTESPFS